MIRRTKVYLRGAYGPGNFGDDVLLLCMIKILKKVFESKDVTISIANTRAGKAIEKNINWVPLNSPVFADITVLGGGGQFYSFKNDFVSYGKNRGIVSYILSLFKKKYTFFDLIIGSYLRMRYGIGYKSKKIAIFCIGVGPFENSFDKEYTKAINVLKKSDYLSVRDEKSKVEVINMCNKVPLQFCDITLNRPLWFNGERSLSKPNHGKPVVGLIIREWSLNLNGFKIIDKLLDFESNNKEYNYVYISLYKKYDQKILDRLKDKKILTWDLDKFTINNFIKQIKGSCDVIISTRAHGVLLPAMAYIPTIAIEIEPKLRAVHEMMPLSTMLVKGSNVSNLSKYIDLCLKYDDGFLEKVDADVENNSIIVQESIASLEEWLIHAK